MGMSNNTPDQNPVINEDGDQSRIGYARVSTKDQSLHPQIDALKESGCGTIYWDHGVSGATTARPGLDAALASTTLRKGDTLVVARLDRLGRTVKHLIATVEDLEGRGVAFSSLNEDMRTDTAAGRMVFTVLCAVAEMERSLIAERTRAGLDAARARGRKGGRRPSLTPAQVEQVHRMRHDQDATLEAIADTFKVSRSTIIRVLSKSPATV